MSEGDGIRDQVFIVTGAGRGVGRATAELLGSRGAKLVLADDGRGPDGEGSDAGVVEEAAEAVRAAGGEALGRAVDVTAAGAAEALVADALEAFGSLAGAVSCAGIRLDRGLLKLEDADLERVLAHQLHAPMRLLRASARHLVEARRPGSVVLAAGPEAFFGTARHAANAAGGAALVALARSAAIELRRHGVRVNVVAPTARTRLTEDLALFRKIGAGSMEPEHAAPLFVHLLSERASDVNGEVLGVAGGRVYAFQSRETTGAFVEGRGFELEELPEAWSEITRG